MEALHNIISPDGFDISMDNFNSKEEAWAYFDEWVKRYEHQGYYSSCKGRIPLDQLKNYVREIEYDIDDEE